MTRSPTKCILSVVHKGQKKNDVYTKVLNVTTLTSVLCMQEPTAKPKHQITTIVLLNQLYLFGGD
jgi:hypothetical protein